MTFFWRIFFLQRSLLSNLKLYMYFAFLNSQLQSMTEAEKCVEDVRRIHRLLKEETGLHTIASADKQVDGRSSPIRL
jgi:hypothetical protein